MSQMLEREHIVHGTPAQRVVGRAHADSRRHMVPDLAERDVVVFVADDFDDAADDGALASVAIFDVRLEGARQAEACEHIAHVDMRARVDVRA